MAAWREVLTSARFGVVDEEEDPNIVHFGVVDEGDPSSRASFLNATYSQVDGWTLSECVSSASPNGNQRETPLFICSQTGQCLQKLYSSPLYNARRSL
jgi:hypothetical protein